MLDVLETIAVEKLQKVNPCLTVRCFEGYGHGDIMNYPEQLVSELIRFLESEYRQQK